MSGQYVATWVQAVGSAGSLLAFATWVGIAILGRKTDTQTRFERQAQTVAAWLDNGADHGAESEYVVCTVNGGDAPVYDCRIRFMGLDERDDPAEVSMNLVPPHTTKSHPMPTTVSDKSWSDVYDSGIAPELTFRDSSGRRWCRDRSGELRQIT